MRAKPNNKEIYMIELINLPLHTRIKLARKSEPFFLAYKRNNQFYPTYKAVTALLTDDQIKKYESEIWTLISATTQTIKYDSDTCQMSFKRDNYITANKITKKKIDCDRMVELVQIFENLNMMTKYKGYFIKDSIKKGVEASMRSLLEFHKSWFSLFDVEKCKLHGTSREFDLVILKDKNGKLITTKGLRGIGDEKKLLKDWNTQIHSTVITIDNDVVTPTYNSVFNEGSLECGGRMFAGTFSTEKSILRPTITIAGNPTTEIDYKNNHFRILYNECGIDFQDDAYAIPCLEGACKIEMRKVTKMAGVIMLNASSRKSAVSALRKKMNSSTLNTVKSDTKTINYIFDELTKLHTPIQKHFFKGEWARLQNIDSKMAKQVVKSFLAIGATVLTYHDSFVCESKHKEYLIKAMKEAWEVVLGDAKGFGYDIEFCNEEKESTAIQPPKSFNNEIPQSVATIEQPFEYDEDYMFWMNLCIDEDIDRLPF